MGQEGFLLVPLRAYEKAALAAAALCMIVPGVYSDGIGISVLALIYFLAKMRKKNNLPADVSAEGA